MDVVYLSQAQTKPAMLDVPRNIVETCVSLFSGYAHLDVSMMGVGVSPVTTLDSNKLEEEEIQLLKLDTKDEDVESDKLVESVTEKDSYANKQEEEVVRRRPPKQLPPGWEKHSDEGGDYYWHVKSGTIQRERPLVTSSTQDEEARKRQRIRQA